VILAEPAQAQDLIQLVGYQPHVTRRSFLHVVPPGVACIVPSDEAREDQRG